MRTLWSATLRKGENRMTYREMAVKTVKLAGQELIDRAE